jgi:hypothetical protein
MSENNSGGGGGNTMKNAIKEAVKQVALNTSTHGVPNLLRTKSLPLRLMWMVFLAGAIGGCCYINAKNIINYLSFGVVTNIRLIYEQNAKFPTFTFCNINPLITDEAIKYSKAKVESLKREALGLNESIDALTQDFEEIRYIITASSLAPNISDEMRRSFDIPLKQMIISCNYNWSPCSYADFEQYFDTYYGNCFKFNSGRNFTGHEVEDRVVTKSGKASGLKLELYLPEPTDYYSFPTSLGCHVFINNKSVIASYFEGLDIPVGAQSNIAITRVFTNRQPKPYSQCVSDQDLSGYSTLTKIFSDRGLKYRRHDCFNYCYQRKVVEVCDCWDLDYPLVQFDKQPCVSLSQFRCTFGLYNKFFADEVVANCTDEW